MSANRTMVRERAAEGSPLRVSLAIMFFAGLSNFSLLCAPAIAAQLGLQLGLGPRDIGLFFSMEFAGYCVAGLAGRWLLPRFSWHRLSIWAAIGMAAGGVLTVLSLHVLALLVLVRLFAASCSAFLGVITMSSANAQPNASRSYGFYVMGQCLTGAVGLALLPLVFGQLGIASYFIGIGTLGLASCWLLPSMLQKNTPTADVAKPVAPRSLAGTFACWPAILFFYLGLGGIWTFSGALGKGAGLDPVMAGRFMSVAAIAGVVGSALAALLGRQKYVAAPVSLGFALLISSVLLLLYTQQWAFIAAMIVFKFSWTFVIPFVFAIVGRLDRSGEQVAQISLMAGIGLALGPRLAGEIVAVSGFPPLLGMEAILVAISFVSVLFLLQMTQPSGASAEVSPQAS